MKINTKIAIIMLAAAMLTGCAEKKETNVKYNSVIDVDVMTVDVSNNENYRNYIGTLKSNVEVPMSFEFGGVLTGVYVHNGQAVKKGDILARVDDRTARSLHETSLASLHQAEDAYERLKKVHDEGGISDVRWVQMLTDLERARQAEVTARKHLEDCTLCAPQDGVVSMDTRIVGVEMLPSEKFCTIVDLNQMMVKFAVPEREIGMLEVGNQVLVKLPSLGEEEYVIKIYDKSLMANRLGHTYDVLAKFETNMNKQLLPGMVAKVRMLSTQSTGIVVPSSCVQTMNDGLSVWVVENGVAKRRSIKVSEFVKNGVMVTDGLNYGDVVVTSGYQKLYNGAKVSY